MGSKTNKGRKIGRNASWCKAYRLGDREKINRKRRWRRLIRNNPKDANLRERYVSVFGEYQESREPSNKIERRIKGRVKHKIKPKKDAA